MTAQLMSGLRYVGVSTDVKPSSLDSERWTFEEKDTGRIYQWNGSEWVYYETIPEAVNRNALQPRSSLIQLFGDTFASTEASAVFLLEDLTDEQGGTSLSDSTSVTFAKDSDLPLRGYNVPTFNGSSQYLSVPTEASVEVGTGSFTASIQFKTINDDFLFQYGDLATKNWFMRINSSTKKLECVIDDGTTTVTSTDEIANHYDDGKWHTATMVWDSSIGTYGTLYLFCDGQLLDSTLAGTSMVTLNDTDGLFIGVLYNGGSLAGYFNGQLANFQLYKSADYNLPALLNANIRESASNDTGAWTQNAEVNSRLNNRFYPSNINGVYTTTVINVSEGFYDLQQLYLTGTNEGISVVEIDGIEHLRQDMYAGVQTFNNLAETKNIFLSGGSHILKWKNDDNNDLSSAFIMPTNVFRLIKRDGTYNESDEATSGILFGDEIRQRKVITSELLSVQTASIFNSVLSTDGSGVTTGTDGDFFEGDIFIKKGNYKCTYTHLTEALGGLADIYFGGVKVFDQIEHHSGLTQKNIQDTRYAFLEGGKTTVKVIVNGTNGIATDLRVIFNALRFELISGKGNGDEVNIWAADDDLETVNGTVPTLTGNVTSTRFNALRLGSDTLADQFLYKRYFSGGTYLVKVGWQRGSNGAIMDIGLDGITDLIFDGINTSGTTLYNQSQYTIKTIPRGFHTINVLAEADGNPADGDYQIVLNYIFCKKIATVLDTLDDNSDGVHGSMVPLASYKARKAEGTVTFNLGNVNPTKYSEIKLVMNGEVTASLAVQMTLNAHASAMYSYGEFQNGVAIAYQKPSDNAAQLTLGSTSTLTGAGSAFLIDAWFQLLSSATLKIGGRSTCVNHLAVTRDELQHLVNTSTASAITSILIKTSTSTWKVGTEINIYGVLK